jgi:hypothetical protein
VATATKARPRDATAERAAIFDEVKAMLAKYSPPFEVRTDATGGYHLWKTKPLVIEGRKRSEVYFAGVIPQKSYVGFYYMPVYTAPEQKKVFEPELLSLLKGKSCFHVKALDPALKKQIRQALADGFKMYKQRGWV